MAYHCVVIGCTNGFYKLNRWKKELCDKHNCYKGEQIFAPAVPPSSCFHFSPSEKTMKREKYGKNL